MPADLNPLMLEIRRLASPDEADARLLARFAHDGDETAFAGLVARHGPMVWRACRRVLPDAHAAEDAFQAVFLVLSRRAGSIARPEALAGWLYGVALRVARKARRRGGAPLATEPAARASGPEAEAAAQELLDVLEEELERLPEGQRLAVLLCGLQGLSAEEAAQRLGWTPGSVKGRLERGRAALHERLARRGLTLPAALGAANVAASAPPALAAASAAATALAEGELAAGGGRALALALALMAGLAAGGAVLLATGQPAAPTAARAAPAGLLPPPPDLRRPSGPEVTMEPSEWVEALAFRPDGRRLAGADADGTVPVWDAATGKLVRTLRPHKGRGRAAAFSPNGKLLLSAATPRGLEPPGPPEFVLSDADTGAVLRRWKGGGAGDSLALAFTPKGKPLTGDKGAVAFSRDGKCYAMIVSAGDGRREVRVCDAASGRAIARANAPLIVAVAFSPDGKRLAGVEFIGKALRVWDASSGKQLLAVPKAHLNGGSAVAFTPDGRRIVTGGNRPYRPLLPEPWARQSDGEVKVWDAKTGEKLLEFFATKVGVNAMALSPDGKRVAVSSTAGYPVTIWRITAP